MALPGYSRYDDPLRVPKAGPAVQNLGGAMPNTAPLANRPPSAQGVRAATPGPATFAAPTPSPVGTPPAAVKPRTGTPTQIAGGFLRDAAQVRAGEPAPGTTPAPLTPAPQFAAPTPSPAGTPPAAVAAPTTPAPSGPGLYGRSGGTSAEAGSLEDSIRQFINKGMGGVTSKAFIDRSKAALGQAVEGQRAQNVNRINEDAIRRGLFRSGIPAEAAAATGVGAQNAFAQGLIDILNKAEQQDIAGRESAAGMAGNLLGMNRSWDQYEQQRADEQAARAAANRQEDTSFDYIDPDTGETYRLDESWFQ